MGAKEDPDSCDSSYWVSRNYQKLGREDSAEGPTEMLRNARHPLGTCAGWSVGEERRRGMGRVENAPRTFSQTPKS